MERWAIINKLILILLIIVTLIDEETTGISWGVLYLLLYFCLNIGMYLLHQRSFITLLLLTSIVLSLFAANHVSSFFILLIPLSIIEFVELWKMPISVALLISVMPAFYVIQDIRIWYMVIAIYTFLTHTMGKIYTEKLDRNEAEMDVLRLNQQRLMRQLHENDTFMKQSAYTLKLEERNRISQEIHDDIGHAITGALIQMEATKKLMTVNPKKAEELLQNAIGITQDGIDRIRYTLKDMKPSTKQVGINRLKLYIDEFAAKHGKHTFLTYHGDMEQISVMQWKVIQENVTESLTNSLKHAIGSTRIDVDIRTLNKLIRVEVRDNGQDADTLQKGLGIIGMEERTASIDGKIIVDGKNGFSVTTLLPIST